MNAAGMRCSAVGMRNGSPAAGHFSAKRDATLTSGRSV
jgi:hypothetical protein